MERYPSKPTLSRILNMIGGDSIRRIIAQIMQQSAESMGEIIAVNGKVIRSTSKKVKYILFYRSLQHTQRILA